MNVILSASKLLRSEIQWWQPHYQNLLKLMAINCLLSIKLGKKKCLLGVCDGVFLSRLIELSCLCSNPCMIKIKNIKPIRRVVDHSNRELICGLNCQESWYISSLLYNHVGPLRWLSYLFPQKKRKWIPWLSLRYYCYFYFAVCS